MTSRSRVGVNRDGREMTRTSSTVRMARKNLLIWGKGSCGRQFSVSITQMPVTSIVQPTSIPARASGHALKSTESA